MDMDGLGMMPIISDLFFIKKNGGLWVRIGYCFSILFILMESTRCLVACCAFSLSLFFVWLFFIYFFGFDMT